MLYHIKLYTMLYKIQPIGLLESRCILDDTSTNLLIVLCAYVALTMMAIIQKLIPLFSFNQRHCNGNFFTTASWIDLKSGSTFIQQHINIIKTGFYLHILHHIKNVIILDL